MKKIGLTLGALLLLTSGFSQGPYATFSTGYAMGAAKDVIYAKTNINSTGDMTSENVYGTSGTGLPINLSFGYMVTEHFGMDLGFSYFLGSEMTVADYNSPGYVVTAKTKSSQIRVLPSLVVSSGSGGGLNFYAKTGLVLPVGGSTTYTQEMTSSSILGTSTTNVAGTASGSFSMGYSGSFGVVLGLSDKLSLFGELQGLNLRIKSAGTTITKYDIDGADYLPLLTKDQIETEYVDVITSADNTDPNLPTKALASTSNYSSFGLNVGIKFNF